MQFLSFYTPANPGPPSSDEQARMGQLIEESLKDGSLVATGAMMGDVVAVRLAGGDFTVKTGKPTTTAVGFAITEARDQEHAIELTKKFLKVAGAGECSVRALMGPPQQ
jgi:hypothetical protein